MKKLLWAAAAVMLLPPLALCGIVIIVVGVVSGSSGCGPGGSPESVAGVHLDDEQMANAQTIVSTVQSILPNTPYAAVVAVATAMQESTLHNYQKAVDHDSLGLFQQRVIYYGADVAADPVKATKAFIDRLVKVPDWQNIPLTQAAQDVQKSAYPDRYAKWEGLANDLVNKLWTGGVATCPDGTGAAGDGGTIKIPRGFELPSNQQQYAVIEFLFNQLGKPYKYGGTGPDSWDCSGLAQAAWAAAGVAIPRTTYDQVTTGVAVPGPAQLQPGDLIFIPGSDGTMSEPGHVGIYVGGDANGDGFLINAPHTGTVVSMVSLKSWLGEIAEIRRPDVYSPRQMAH